MKTLIWWLALSGPMVGPQPPMLPQGVITDYRYTGEKIDLSPFVPMAQVHQSPLNLEKLLN